MKHTSNSGAPDYFEQENTMRRLQERDPLRTKEQMIEKFKHYVSTYDRSMTLKPETFIRDMLYGMGRAMSHEYEFAVGYLKFAARVNEMLEADLPKMERKR